MASVKFTAKRGDKPEEVTVAAGSAEAQTDTMSLNVDYAKMTKGDVLIQLKAIEHRVHSGPWPPL